MDFEMFPAPEIHGKLSALRLPDAVLTRVPLVGWLAWNTSAPEICGKLYALRSLDAVLTCVPLVRWLAWNIVMWGEKPR